MKTPLWARLKEEDNSNEVYSLVQPHGAGKPFTGPADGLMFTVRTVCGAK